jgi:hypothetical protein
MCWNSWEQRLYEEQREQEAMFVSDSQASEHAPPPPVPDDPLDKEREPDRVPVVTAD